MIFLNIDSLSHCFVKLSLDDISVRNNLRNPTWVNCWTHPLWTLTWEKCDNSEACVKVRDWPPNFRCVPRAAELSLSPAELCLLIWQLCVVHTLSPLYNILIISFIIILYKIDFTLVHLIQCNYRTKIKGYPFFFLPKFDNIIKF